LGADFTAVIVTARYKCFSNIPAILLLKKDDDTFSTADIYPVYDYLSTGHMLQKWTEPAILLGQEDVPSSVP
jgi:hypothetical protein